VKHILLSQGMRSVIDDVDFLALSRYRWYTRKCRGLLYAGRTLPGSKGGVVYMHRQIMGFPPMVDHRDGDGLNNQRSNLRVCTYSQNGRNRKQINGNSGLRGVRHRTNCDLWEAYIKVNGKFKHLGDFDTKREAAIAYNNAVKQYDDGFGRENVLPPIIAAESCRRKRRRSTRVSVVIQGEKQ
jgi:hypothetical protein